jgi:hypothetical protein
MSLILFNDTGEYLYFFNNFLEILWHLLYRLPWLAAFYFYGYLAARRIDEDRHSIFKPME